MYNAKKCRVGSCSEVRNDSTEKGYKANWCCKTACFGIVVGVAGESYSEIICGDALTLTQIQVHEIQFDQHGFIQT